MPRVPKMPKVLEVVELIKYGRRNPNTLAHSKFEVLQTYLLVTWLFNTKQA